MIREVRQALGNGLLEMDACLMAEAIRRAHGHIVQVEVDLTGET